MNCFFIDEYYQCIVNVCVVNRIILKHRTTGNFNQEAADVQVIAQIHHLPYTDLTSNDSVDLLNYDVAPS